MDKISNELGLVIGEIVEINSTINQDWNECRGWAPEKAVSLLEKLRLERQVAFSIALRRWIVEPESEESEAVQVLAYTNLCALLEGSLAMFLSLYVGAYEADPNASLNRKKAILSPDRLSLENLRQFTKASILDEPEDMHWNVWIEKIQLRRNAIHSFVSRDLGSHSDFTDDVKNYRDFLKMLVERMPPSPESFE